MGPPGNSGARSRRTQEAPGVPLGPSVWVPGGPGTLALGKRTLALGKRKRDLGFGEAQAQRVLRVCTAASQKGCSGNASTVMHPQQCIHSNNFSEKVAPPPSRPLSRPPGTQGPEGGDGLEGSNRATQEIFPDFWVKVGSCRPRCHPRPMCRDPGKTCVLGPETVYLTQRNSL